METRKFSLLQITLQSDDLKQKENKFSSILAITQKAKELKWKYCGLWICHLITNYIINAIFLTIFSTDYNIVLFLILPSSHQLFYFILLLSIMCENCEDVMLPSCAQVKLPLQSKICWNREKEGQDVRLSIPPLLVRLFSTSTSQNQET